MGTSWGVAPSTHFTRLIPVFGPLWVMGATRSKGVTLGGRGPGDAIGEVLLMLMCHGGYLDDLLHVLHCECYRGISYIKSENIVLKETNALFLTLDPF